MHLHNRSLDGVRAFSILLVLFCHYNLFPMGWVGVDVFFVLSGYLITGILRRSCTEVFFWKTFYIKRATRLLPALLLILFAVSLSPYRRRWWETALYLLSLGDVLAYLTVGTNPLGPLWSLAVEEHFYLIWPVLIRKANRKTLLRILTGIVVLSPVVRFLIAPLGWRIIYCTTLFRLDGIAFGAILALLLESESSKRLVRRLSAPGFVLSAVCLALFKFLRGPGGASRATGGAPFQLVVYTLVALLAAFLISYLLTHPESKIAAIFSISPLGWIAKVSYGTYVYHSLIESIVVDHTHLSRLGTCFVGMTATFMAGGISFYLIENPINAWGHRKADSYRKSRKPVEPIYVPAINEEELRRVA